MRYSTILLAACVAVLLGCSASMAQVVNATESLVTASGTGSVTIPTTIAQIQLGVQADSSNASLAQAQAANASQAIVTALQSLNVSKLQTSSISLTQISFPSPTPFGSSSGGGSSQTTFRASNIVSFEVPVDRAGEAIDAAVAAGANTILSVNLVPSDNNVTLAQQEATRLAVANGISNARLVVNELGCQVVGVGTINLSPAIVPASSSIMAAAVQGATTPVLGGEVDITSTVQVNLLHSCPSSAISAINSGTFSNATTTA